MRLFHRETRLVHAKAENLHEETKYSLGKESKVSLFKTKERSHGTSDTPAFASQSCWRNEKEWKVFPRELGAATIY